MLSINTSRACLVFFFCSYLAIAYVCAVPTFQGTGNRLPLQVRDEGGFTQGVSNLCLIIRIFWLSLPYIEDQLRFLSLDSFRNHSAVFLSAWLSGWWVTCICQLWTGSVFWAHQESLHFSLFCNFSQIGKHWAAGRQPIWSRRWSNRALELWHLCNELSRRNKRRLS